MIKKILPKKYPKGFTLIEIIGVMAIISILTGISIIGLRSYRAKAGDTQAKTDLHKIQAALVAYAADHNNKFPISDGECLGDSDSTVGQKLAGNGSIDSIPVSKSTRPCYEYVSTDGKHYTLSTALISDPNQSYVIENETTSLVTNIIPDQPLFYKVKSLTGPQNSTFGYILAIDGNNIAVGEDSNVGHGGSVYFYDLNGNQVAAPINELGTTQSDSWNRVAIKNNKAYIAAQAHLIIYDLLTKSPTTINYQSGENSNHTIIGINNKFVIIRSPIAQGEPATTDVLDIYDLNGNLKSTLNHPLQCSGTCWHEAATFGDNNQLYVAYQDNGNQVDKIYDYDLTNPSTPTNSTIDTTSYLSSINGLNLAYDNSKLFILAYGAAIPKVFVYNIGGGNTNPPTNFTVNGIYGYYSAFYNHNNFAAISGKLYIGGPASDTYVPNKVLIYKPDGTLIHTITWPDPATTGSKIEDDFGYALTVSSDRLIIGAFAYRNGSQGGLVNIYTNYFVSP